MLRCARVPCGITRVLPEYSRRTPIYYTWTSKAPLLSKAHTNAGHTATMKLLFLTFAATLCSLASRGLPVNAEDTCLVQLHDRELQSELSECTGNFLLRVKPWYGRTGNNLISLANVIYLARLTYSEVLAGAHPLLKRNEWDFRVQSEKDRERNIRVLGAGTLGRQVAFTDNYYFESKMPIRVAGWSFGSTKQREVLINDVLPALRVSPMHSRNAVVVHVRSGDVFTHEVSKLSPEVSLDLHLPTSLWCNQSTCIFSLPYTNHELL